ncbi:Zinc finger C2H2-type, partial [Trinorchestia longiramus]
LSKHEDGSDSEVSLPGEQNPYYCSQSGSLTGFSPAGSSGSTVGGPNSFPCPVCGRFFARQWHLKRHMNIHLAIKPYNCPFCPHAANVKSNLQVHIRNMHSDLLLLPP